MDYFIDVLAMFLDLDHVITLLTMGRSESSRISSNIFICVLKMNEGLTGLEQHEGE